MNDPAVMDASKPARYLAIRISAAQHGMATPWDSARSERVLGAALKMRGARARRHRAVAILGVVASAALFVFAVRAGHHVHFSAPLSGSGGGGGSDPSASFERPGTDDLGTTEGPLTLNGDAFADGGSEAD